MDISYSKVIYTSYDLLTESEKPPPPRTALTTRLKWFIRDRIYQFNELSTTKRILTIIAIALTVLVVCVVVPAVVVSKTPAVPMFLYVPSVNCSDYTTLSANQATVTLNGTVQVLVNMMNVTHFRPSYTITLKYLSSTVLIVSTNTTINWITYNLQNVTVSGSPEACILYIGDSTPQLMINTDSITHALSYTDSATVNYPAYSTRTASSTELTTVTDFAALWTTVTTLTGTNLILAFLNEGQTFVSDSVSFSATTAVSHMYSSSASLNQAITHPATVTSIASSTQSASGNVSTSRSYSASSTRSTTVTVSTFSTYSASSTRSATVTVSASSSYSVSSTRSETVTVQPSSTYSDLSTRSATVTVSPSSTSSSIQKKLVLVFLKFKDETSTLQPAQTLLNLAFGQNSAFENVNSIFKRLSSGSASYVGINSTLPNASNWTVINRSVKDGCDTAYYSSAASSFITSTNASISSYDNVIIVLSSTAKCTLPLFISSTMILIPQGSLTTGSSAVTLVKNLLSNSGLGTADLLSCTSGFSNWTLCNPQTSKDPYDLMGSQVLAPANLQMSSRVQLGWLPTSNVLVLSDATTLQTNLVSMNYAALSDISFITYLIFTLLEKTRVKVNYTLELQSYTNLNGSLLCGVVVRMSRDSRFKYYIATLDMSNPNYIDQDNKFTIIVKSIQSDCSQASISIQTYKIAPSTLSVVDNRPTIMMFGYFAQNPVPTLDMFWLRDFYFGNNLTKSDSTRNVNHIYARNSLNYTQFVGLYSADVDVYPVWIPLTNACSWVDWLYFMISTSGINSNQYKNIIMNVVNSTCPFSGSGILYGNAVILTGYPVSDTDYLWHGVLAHEIGHNVSMNECFFNNKLGLNHAGSATDTLTGRTEVEYGDMNDIMGMDLYSERPNFGMRNRIYLGWLSNDNLAVITTPGNRNYTIMNTQFYNRNLSFGIKVQTLYFELYQIIPWRFRKLIMCSILVRDTLVNNGGSGAGGGYDIVTLQSHILVASSTYNNSMYSMNVTVISIASDCSSAVVDVVSY